MLRYIVPVAATIAAGSYFASLIPLDAQRAQRPVHGASLETVYENDSLALALRIGDDVYGISMGPLGPRIGSVGYLVQNLSQSEKILLLEEVAADLPLISERVVFDFLGNHDRVLEDIRGKLEDMLRGGY